MRRCRTCHFAPCRCEDLEAGYMGAANLPACWPMKSEALAVHPDQVQEATNDAKAKGVPTDFDKSGRPIFTDRAHRRAYCRRYGFYDRDAGYSDAQRGSCTAEVPDRPDPVKEIFG